MRTLLAGALFLGASTAAHALTTTQTVTFSLTGYDDYLGQTAYVPYFDPNLGTLDAATFDLKGYIQPKIDFAPPAVPSSSPFAAREYAYANFGIIPTPGGSKSFTASNVEDLGLIPGGSMGYTSVGGTGLKFDFTGGITTQDATGPGQFDVTFGGQTDPVVNVGEAYDASQVVGVLTVTYSYTPVPEPIGAAVLGVGLVGVLAVRRRAERVG